MSTVQVALSFAVEIWKFHNIDLFHQGAFQIRSYFKTIGASPALIEKPKVWDRSKSAPFPECTQQSFVSEADPRLGVPCKAVSKSVLIMYKEESLRMRDVFEQTMHLQMEALAIEEQVYRTEIVLVVELWFGEKKNESIEEMKCVCERQLKVHLLAGQGLHHHTTVIFDYYYLSAVELVVHASLVSISPCYLHLQSSATAPGVPSESDAAFERNVALYQSWSSILFGVPGSAGRRHTASVVHTHLCQLLIRVIDSLKATVQAALAFLSAAQRSRIDSKLQSQLCPTVSKSIDWTRAAPNELERLAVTLQAQTSEDDIADQASIDITRLSSRIVVLFNEFLKTASFHPGYVEQLSLRTHKLRIKRFSEAFFFQEFPIVHLLAVYDPKYANPLYLSDVFGRGRPAQPTVGGRDARGHAGSNGHHHRDASACGSAEEDDDSLSVSSSDSAAAASASSDELHGVGGGARAPGRASVGGGGGGPQLASSQPCALTARSSATLVRHGSKYNAFVPFSVNSHEALAAKVRDSAYYKRLPPLPIECPDTDGESHDQPIILEEIFVPEKTRSIIMRMSINSSNSRSSSSDTDAPRRARRVSNGSGDAGIAEKGEGMAMYKKRRAAMKGTAQPVSRLDSASSIPILRKLNQNFNRKNLPVQEKPVKLVGYRSMDCSAFYDQVHGLAGSPPLSLMSGCSPSTAHQLPQEPPDSVAGRRTASSRSGIGTLSRLDGPDSGYTCGRCGGLTSSGVTRADAASAVPGRSQLQQASCMACTKALSSSMPDLSQLGALFTSSSCSSLASSSSRSRLAPLRKKRATPDKDRSARACICSDRPACCHAARVASMLADSAPGDGGGDASGEEVTMLEMLSSSASSSCRTQRPVSAYVPSKSAAVAMAATSNTSDAQYLTSCLRAERKFLSQSSSELGSLGGAARAELGALGEQVTFWQLKTRLMADLSPQFQGHVYSEMRNVPASERPYFSLRDVGGALSPGAAPSCAGGGLHYVVCVHGLDGEHRDLRLVRAYLCLALPEQRFEFLMSEANEQDTFADLAAMQERLVDELLDRLAELREPPSRISFIGHSLGCVLVRAAIASPRLGHLVSRFHAFLSLGGPHLGTVYGSSVLVNVGLWVMQKVRKSACLQQLALRDSPEDLRQSFMYRLSGQPGLEHFRYVLLASSAQDRYVPYHSTRIELCRAAVKDNSEMGVVYMEMVTKILQRLLRSDRTTVIRYDANYTLPRSANNYIGRAAHIALIDSELFLEKFICVSAAKYFR